MTYSPTPRYRDVFQSAPGGGFVEKVKGFLRKIIPAPDSVVNLVRDNRPLPRFEDSNLGRHYIDSTGGRHWTGNNIIYEYKDGIDGLTHWFTPEEIEARIEYTKPTALKVEESDNTPCDPEAVPGGVVSYNVSLASYYDRRAAANLRAPGPSRYSPQEVAAVRAATPYHPSTRTGIGQIINVNTERLARADFEVTELKDISDINLSTSKTKQPLAVKEPGNRRFQFEQEKPQ